MRGLIAIDHVISAFAAGQHGVVARRQLLELGLTDDAVDRRVAAGRLHRLYRGVFAVGHPVLTIEGRWMAAVLAGGDNAVLSHATAAAAWELRPIGTGAIHVTITGDAGRRRRAGLRIHRSVALTPRKPRHTAASRSRSRSGRSSTSPPPSKAAHSSKRSTSPSSDASSTSPTWPRAPFHAPYKRCCRPTGRK